MSRAHANRDDLQRLQRSVREAQAEIEQSLKKLQKALASADWNDSARRSFEQKLNEAAAAVHRTNQQLGELTPILNRTIADLDAYLRRR